MCSSDLVHLLAAQEGSERGEYSEVEEGSWSEEVLYNIRLVHIWRLVSHHVLAFIRLQVICNTYIPVASYDTDTMHYTGFQRSS